MSIFAHRMIVYFQLHLVKRVPSLPGIGRQSRQSCGMFRFLSGGTCDGFFTKQHLRIFAFALSLFRLRLSGRREILLSCDFLGLHRIVYT